MTLLLGKSRETIIHVRVSTGTSGSFAGVRLTPLGGSGGGAIATRQHTPLLCGERPVRRPVQPFALPIPPKFHIGMSVSHVGGRIQVRIRLIHRRIASHISRRIEFVIRR